MKDCLAIPNVKGLKEVSSDARWVNSNYGFGLVDIL